MQNKIFLSTLLSYKLGKNNRIIEGEFQVDLYRKNICIEKRMKILQRSESISKIKKNNYPFDNTSLSSCSGV